MKNKELDNQLLNRVKYEIEKENRNMGYDFVGVDWPEVCRRYAEEYEKENVSIIQEGAEEIFQLKKQLEDKQLSVDGYKRSFDLANDELQKCRESNEDLKSKLEVKEKPELDYFKTVIDQLHIAIESRDAKIAELEKDRDELNGSETDLAKRLFKLESELKEAKELLTEIYRSLYIGPDLKDSDIMDHYIGVVNEVKQRISDFSKG